MKGTVFSLALLSVAALTSCDTKNKLADELVGSWSGAPERIVDNSAASAMMISTYDFSKPSASTPGGDVIVSGLVSVTSQATGSEGLQTPYALTANGTATIKGSWEVISDDEISFNWDVNSLIVQVDPEAVNVSVSNSTGEPSAQVDSMKPQLAKALELQLRQVVGGNLMSIQKFDDIKIKNSSVLEYEINDKDYLMKRQGM